jgi:hypothetical protein
MMFFFLGYILLKENKFWGLLLVIFIASFNRETPIFLALFYFVYSFRTGIFNKTKKLIKFILKNGLLVLSWAIPYISLRIYFGIRNEANLEIAGIYSQLPHNLAPLNLTLLFVFLGIIWILAYINIKDNDLFTKRIMYIIPLFILVHFIMGHINETRLFLPITPPLLISGFKYLFKKIR